jgi:hypothetical protein
MPAFRFARRGHGERETEGRCGGSGKWNFANATGTLNLKGVLHVVLGNRSAAMKSVTFTRPAKGNGHVTVKLAGHEVQLFTVTGKVKVKHSGATETLTGMTAKLTKAGASKLDKALHKNALTELTLGTGTEGSSLSFEMNGGPEVKLFDIDTSQLEQAATPDRTLDLNGLLAKLSSEGASSLNTILGTNAFTTGEPVGGVSVILPAAAAGS